MPNRPPRILLVDDEADARDMLRLALERHGFHVTTATDGSEAVTLLDQGFDAVITDLVMPHLDGIALLACMAERKMEVIRVVITSFADKERVMAALNGGAHYLIEKPFTGQQLVEVLGRLLAERKRDDGFDQLCQFRLAALGINERERELVVWLLKGLPNREIAAFSQLSEQVVKNRLFQLYRRLGVNSRGELFHLVFPV